MVKLLLHTCCTPCGIYPLRELRKEGFAVSAFFYNPNIHPQEEYARRRKAAESWAKDEGCELIAPAWRPEEFLQAIGKETKAPARCALCWRLRIMQTALAAGQGGFSHFTTTLLASPYQDQEKIKEIGEDPALARNGWAKFYFADFRDGFRSAHKEAKEKGFYCQKYCGCARSLEERCKKSPRP